MDHIEIVKAINHIRPNAEFVLRGEQLEWLDIKQSEPTKNEIEAGFIAYKSKVETDKAEAKAKRDALLERLGITEEDFALLTQSI